MKKAIGIVLLAGLPALAHAQAPTQVPAIMQGSADAAASVTGSATSRGEPAAAKVLHRRTPGRGQACRASKAAGPVPAQMPPPVQLVSPSAPLDAKERHAVILARRWRNRREMPQPGEDGVVRFLFGATLPTVVCAPLQVCNLALQPGEVVNDVQVGDNVRWKISPSISGSGERTDHASDHQAGGCGARLEPQRGDEPAHLRDQAGVYATRLDAAGRVQLSG